MARTRRPTIAERRQAALEQRREAVATLGLLARMREIVGDALASRVTGVPASPDPGWRADFDRAFAELHVRMEEVKRTRPQGVVIPEVWKLDDDGPEYTEEQAREFMRELHGVITKELARQEAEGVPRTPEIRKIQRMYRDFQESYERIELSERIQAEVAALLREVNALRDMASGTVISAMLGGAPQRGAS